jgi:hypothetical protein
LEEAARGAERQARETMAVRWETVHWAGSAAVVLLKELGGWAAKVPVLA